MYAIVEIGGKHYKAEKGMDLLVDKIDAKAGQKLQFKTVTLYRTDKEVEVGTPYVEKMVIEGKVIDPVVKGKKEVVYKYKQKTSYRRKTGHRQQYTKVQITSIGHEKPKAAKSESAEEKA